MLTEEDANVTEACWCGMRDMEVTVYIRLNVARLMKRKLDKIACNKGKNCGAVTKNKNGKLVTKQAQCLEKLL